MGEEVSAGEEEGWGGEGGGVGHNEGVGSEEEGRGELESAVMGKPSMRWMLCCKTWNMSE